MMSARPAISILLTAYNRAPFIRASIESVLQQTFTDFELLIVDDCSTDGTCEVAREYECDGRVRVIRNERNLGQFPNRNHAAALACADLLKFHDSDDVMYPHCLQVMVSMMLAEPRAGFGLSLGTGWPGGPCPMLLTPRLAYQREYFGDGVFSSGPAGAVFRADVFRRLGGFEDAGVASDTLFWIRACTTEQLLLLPADLFWYRLHPGQEFQSENAQHDYAKTAGWHWDALHARECPLTAHERERAKRNRAYHLAKRTVQDLRRGRAKFALERFRHSNMSVWDWIRYLRPPERHAFAGTPLTADGDFIMPVADPRTAKRSPKRNAS